MVSSEPREGLGVGNNVFGSRPNMGCPWFMCGVNCRMSWLMLAKSFSDGENGMQGDCSALMSVGVGARSLLNRFISSSWCSLFFGVSGAGTNSSFWPLSLTTTLSLGRLVLRLAWGWGDC